MARLYVLSGADIGRTLDVERSATIGRDAACDLRLRDASISRRHARVELAGAGWEIVDEGSRNGVTIDGARVERRRLVDGQEFQLGEVLLRFRESVAPAVRSPVPASPTTSASRAPTADAGLELEEADQIELGAQAAAAAAPARAGAERLREQRGRILQYHRAAESDSLLSFEFAQMPLWQRALVLVLATALMGALAWGAFLGAAFVRGKLAATAVESTG
jgi:pSer/pThr/pTyr-binding forkhead associated (FHA) protein